MNPQTIPVLSPIDGRRTADPPIRSAEEVRAAIERARAAQQMWIQRPLAQRLAVLRRVGRTLSRERDRWADLVRSETGKPRTEALAEILAAIEAIRFYARVAPEVLREQRVSTGWIRGKSGRIVREPWGVVGSITPWNYPLTLTLDAVLAAVFGGNGVVVKPSEFTPSPALALPELFTAAGAPPGLIEVVTGDASTGAALVSGGIDKLVFTGSSATGRVVMAAAASHLVPVVLELGGKDPAVVLEDADLDRAAHGVVFGALFNAGQTCISTERVFVVDSVHDALVERIVNQVRSLRCARSDDADVGPLVTPAQRAIVAGQIAEAIAQGARALVGGAPEGDDQLIAPTVLTEVTPEMSIARDETFGPVIPILRVRDADEAVARIADTPWGLFGSVWTRDLRRGREIARRIRAGGVSINDTLTHYAVAELPMGGVADSGFGRRRGREGLEEMTRSRTLLTHHFGTRRELWWYPYGRRSEALAEAMIVFRSEGWLRGLPEVLRIWRRFRSAPSSPAPSHRASSPSSSGPGDA